MKRIYVAGHHGMVGSALCRHLSAVPCRLVTRSRGELDLTCQRSVAEFFQHEAVDQVYLAAAKVGGIHANEKYPASFIYQNLMIECNVIEQAFLAGVKQLLFLGSSCIYPRYASQPITENELLSGVLEKTNEPYAIAKIAGIKLCESYNRQYGVDYRAVMPTNLYGEGDNFHPEHAHVIPSIMYRIHKARELNSASVTIWGTGRARREFLHVNDLACACIRLMAVSQQDYVRHTAEQLSHINIGTGRDCTIDAVVEMLMEIIGYDGSVRYDHSRPDGTPRKVLNVKAMQQLTGWSPTIDFETGLRSTYDWFLANQHQLRTCA